MGHEIERQALLRGHEIVARIDVDNRDELHGEAFRSADVAIEFTAPAAAFDNCREALGEHVPVVSGSTGWLDRLPELRAYCDAHPGAALLQSTNFSIGMNIFMRLNRELARLTRPFIGYVPSLEETHHVHKLDHPSGTAITLAEGIMANDPAVKGWGEPQEGVDLPEGILPIGHERVGEVPGTHIITWTSPVDAITLEHKAFSRDGFALGAVMAAEWVHANPDVRGLLGMEQMLGEL